MPYSFPGQVFIGITTARGTQPVVPRLKGIHYSNPLGDYTNVANLATDDGCSGHCFDVRLQEPSCFDDLHLAEEIHYMVLEAGTWYTDEGRMMQIGRLMSSGANGAAMGVGGQTDASLAGGWSTVTYHMPFADDMVSAITQVQTYNDPAFVKARNRPLGADSDPTGGRPLGTYSTGFEVALERENAAGGATGAVADSGAHAIEAIGWMALPHGKGTIGGDLYQASITENVVTHDPMTGGIAFCAGFTNPPLLFGNMATHHGSDSAEIRLSRGVTADDAAVFVEEESCSDDELLHNAEVISYFAFQSGGGHKIRARASAPANVPAPSDMVVCTNTAAGGTLCCGDLNDPACSQCWGLHHQAQLHSSATTCTERATQTFNSMNAVCCADPQDCSTGHFPTDCSTDCAALWMPIWRDCGSVVTNMFAGSPDMSSTIQPFSRACETTFLGSGAGRCDNAYWAAGLQLIDQNCDGPNGLSFGVAGGHLQGSFLTTCSQPCKEIFEPFYTECVDKIALEAYQTDPTDARSYAGFLAICQATPAAGGGH